MFPTMNMEMKNLPPVKTVLSVAASAAASVLLIRSITRDLLLLPTMNMEMKNISPAKTVLSVAASTAASVVLIRSIARDLLPYEIHHFFGQKIALFLASISRQITVTIDELDGLHENNLFQAAELYLGAKLSPSSRRLKASIPAQETKVVLSVDDNQDLVDVFNGVPLKWTKINTPIPSRSNMYYDDRIPSTYKTEVSHFELSFHKKHRQMVLDSYFPYILSEALKLKQENKTLKIHTLRIDSRGIGYQWEPVNLDHPSTFDTLAMDLDLKKTVMEDLELFLRRKDFYRKVGKAWKRGYLLFGPPGTGKSSLIAAMANYLNFDIYDLELTTLNTNSELQKLIMRTANRSILVVEDIDCSIDLKRKKAAQSQVYPPVKEITLSGLLNFIDGLWSSCGNERIIIFTTNHKERLDPALLRPGRMDVHIHMSYCTPCGFKILVSNYLGLTDHPLLTDIEELIPEAQVTPAEVGEQLLKIEDPEAALEGLLEFIRAKKPNEDNEMVARDTKDEADI